MKRALVLCGLALATIGTSARAADPSTQAKALADEALRLSNENRLDEACPKFAESLRIEPTLPRMLDAAACFDKRGDIATALAHYKDAIAVAETLGDPRAAAARERANALRLRVPRLVVEVQEPIFGLEVRRDGVPLAPQAYGQAVNIDPGEHVITATAPGKRSWFGLVRTTDNGAASAVVVPKLEDEPATVYVARRSRDEITIDRDTPPKKGDTQRVIGLALAGLGIAGIGMGTVFGLQAKFRLDESNTYCRGNICDQEVGVERRKQAKESAQVATYTFGAAIVTGLTGAALYFFAPRESLQKDVAIAPTWTRGGAGAEVTTSW